MTCFCYWDMYYNVGWVMEFLTCAYKLSLILSKNDWPSRNCWFLWIDIRPGPQKVSKLYFNCFMPKNSGIKNKWFKGTLLHRRSFFTIFLTLDQSHLIQKCILSWNFHGSKKKNRTKYSLTFHCKLRFDFLLSCILF